MKFMIHWKLTPGFHQAAAEAFLQTGAPAPAGVTIVGRWHAPGSGRGWALMEADDPAAMALHSTTWAKFLETDVTPVVEDDVAAQAFAQVYGG